MAAAVGIGVGAMPAPAGAMPKDPCAIARARFRSYMDDARFWIGAADTLAAAGNEAMANQASIEANYYLGLAEGALGDMAAAC